jgi:hypothetical protein
LSKTSTVGTNSALAVCPTEYSLFFVHIARGASIGLITALSLVKKWAALFRLHASISTWHD